MTKDDDGVAEALDSGDETTRQPQHHRTVDRVTQILEEVVYHPGLTFAELARTLGAPKSSVYGFMQGLLATGWLYEQDRRYYLGPAVHGLTLASGQVRAGLVSQDVLVDLHRETGLPVFLGVEAGDHLIYIAEAGGDSIADIEARRNIRRTLLATATGKALLAARPQDELKAFLRRHSRSDAALVESFLSEYDEIKRTGIATNVRLSGTRYAIATVVPSISGKAPAAVALVGATTKVKPRAKKLADLLLERVATWANHPATAREAI
ncbi:helix-turn-helix domain-containing protein [Sphingomonas ginsenosidivorax]|uniref:Helix-turn-helix domain-containing protein n=1 Tax=Sphingomonas ginsenosidivorax TaxID=862135 RepID=A0A5C6UE96_9SPHN|nr:helix-turn-helix domain-containing protein [Sphingomonas ginsenosidivorax]TXC71083.1 helix-turn-helix domain-containing protein [Sphingomonas ginsenosidivorax]